MDDLLGVVGDWLDADATFPIESGIYPDLRPAA